MGEIQFMESRNGLYYGFLHLLQVTLVYSSNFLRSDSEMEWPREKINSYDILYTQAYYKDIISKALEISLGKYGNNTYYLPVNPNGQSNGLMSNESTHGQKINAEFDVKRIENHVFVLEETTKQLEIISGISYDTLQKSDIFTKLFKEIMRNYCPKAKLKCDASTKYRTIDGSCNNLQHPTWGRSYTSKPRYMEPVYGDDLKSPRMFGTNGEQLPSARLISNVLMKSPPDPLLEHGQTLMVMAWGQFITHDMMFTPTTSDENFLDIDCCKISVKSDQCFNIQVPDNDEYFNSTCMSFTRATPGPIRPPCKSIERQQINMQTSYIDASNVYGATKDRLKEIRSYSKGQMKLLVGGLPPLDPNPHSCLVHKKEHYCLRGGDDRINVLPHLEALHTLFLREHNRIAKELGEINTHWNDEQLFQETRKIIGAIFQHITYTEYLPNILSEQYLHETRRSGTYDHTINPSIRNAFAAAAFRFGHSEVPRIMAYVLSNFTFGGKIDVKDSYGNPEIVERHHGENIPDFFRWLSTNLLFKVDRFFESSVRDHLFFQNGRSFDLASINIQRGRDHGLPAYNKWREFCGMSIVTHFNVSKGGLVDHSQETVELLSTLYRNVEDIDFYVGGISEEHIEGGTVGPTFACLIAMQFRALKIGDRFWYERQGVPTALKRDQLLEVKKIKLSRVLCNNLDMGQIQPYVFHTLSQKNKLGSCDILPQIDLTKWKDKR